MTASAIQDDFGGFDSRFLGITLRMWPKSWELFRHFHGRDRKPPHVVSIGDAALQKSADEAFEVFSAGTVLIHELRHFHDFLLSPYGNHIFRRRIMAAINGTAAAGHLIRAKTAIPVPLGRWRSMNPPERDECLSQWCRWYGVAPNQFKLELGDEFEHAIQNVDQAFGRIKDMITAPAYIPSMEYQPSHIFEGSAINIQAGHVWTVFGVRHTQLFLDYLLRRPELRTYTLALRALYALADRRGQQLDSTIAGAMLTWSILGDYAVSAWDACPTVRFAQLSQFVEQNGMPMRGMSVRALFSIWSERLGLPNVFETVEKASKANRSTMDQLQNLPIETRSRFNGLISLFGQFAEAHEKMAGAFSADPQSYVRPDLYAESEAEWVAAPIRLQFPYFPLLIPDVVEKSPFKILSAQTTDDGKLAVRSALLEGQSPGAKVFDGDVVSSVNDELTMVDFLFSDFNRDDPDFDIARRTFANHGTVVVELL